MIIIKRGNHRINYRFVALLGMCTIVFSYSFYMLVMQLFRENQEKEKFEELSTLIEESSNLFTAEVVPISYSTHEEQEDVPNIMPKYMTLYEENPDLAGWLQISDTGINYPVMFTPEEPNYYLYRAFDGSSSQSGVPYIGAGGTPDSDSLIIHGHNMRNDSMFGSLDDYMEEAFREEHPVISFDTLYEEREYKVFAAVKYQVSYDGDEDLFDYYNYAGELKDVEFQLLRDWLIENAVYDTGIVPQEGDQILILSTCSYHTSDGRFLVAAYRTNEKTINKAQYAFN